MRFVQKVNANHAWGHLTDLGSFLFGRERACWSLIAPFCWTFSRVLASIARRIFTRSMEVDHFIPWSRYPPTWATTSSWPIRPCNNAKSDHIAAEEHLAAWIERNQRTCGRNQPTAWPRQRCRTILAASVRIAEWAYEQTERAHGQVWVGKDVFRHLGPSGGGCWWRDSWKAPLRAMQKKGSEG